MIPTPSRNGRVPPLQPEGCGALLAALALLGAWVGGAVLLVLALCLLRMLPLLGR